MGTIRKIGDDYFIEFTARGLLYQQKAGRDQAVAERVLQEVESKIAKGELLTVVRQIHWKSFWENFLKESAPKYSPVTNMRFRRVLQHFSAFVQDHEPGVENISHINPVVIEHYRAYLLKGAGENTVGKRNPKVINLSLLLLREVFEFGIKTGFINDNPTLHIQLLKVPARSEVFSPGQIELILKNGDMVLNMVIPFILETGLRLGELIQLTWMDVDWTKSCLKIAQGPAKREVPLSLNAVAILKEQAERTAASSSRVFMSATLEPLDREQLTGALQSALKKSGISYDIGFQHFRQDFVVRNLRRGLSVFRLAEILGVADIAKMMVYAPWIPLSREEAYQSGL